MIAAMESVSGGGGQQAEKEEQQHRVNLPVMRRLRRHGCLCQVCVGEAGLGLASMMAEISKTKILLDARWSWQRLAGRTTPRKKPQTCVVNEPSCGGCVDVGGGIGKTTRMCLYERGASRRLPNSRREPTLH